MKRQVNAVLKNELKDILYEVVQLRDRVNEITCDNDCEGCGEHAPMRRESILAGSDIGTNSVENEDKEQSDEEKGGGEQ